MDNEKAIRAAKLTLDNKPFRLLPLISFEKLYDTP